MHSSQEPYLTTSILMNRSFREFGDRQRETFLNALSDVMELSRDEFHNVKFWDGCVTCQLMLPRKDATRLVRDWEIIRSGEASLNREVTKMKEFVDEYCITSIYSLEVTGSSSQYPEPDFNQYEFDLEDEINDNLDNMELPYDNPDEESFFERQSQLFKEKKAFLVKHFLNLYVLFEDGQVLGSSLNRSELIKKAYKEGGIRPLFIKKVLDEEEPKPQLFTPFF